MESGHAPKCKPELDWGQSDHRSHLNPPSEPGSGSNTATTGNSAFRLQVDVESWFALYGFRYAAIPNIAISEELKAKIQRDYQTDRHWSKVLPQLRIALPDSHAEFLLRDGLIYHLDNHARLGVCLPISLVDEALSLVRDVNINYEPWLITPCRLCFPVDEQTTNTIMACPMVLCSSCRNITASSENMRKLITKKGLTIRMACDTLKASAEAHRCRFCTVFWNYISEFSDYRDLCAHSDKDIYRSTGRYVAVIRIRTYGRPYKRVSDIDFGSFSFHFRIEEPFLRYPRTNWETFNLGGKMFAAYDNPAANFISNREDDTDPGYPAAYSQIRAWISTCNQSHTCCGGNDPYDLPSRVLDVGSITGSEHPKLYITQGEQEHYIALSYCWGSSQQITATSASIAGLCQGMPLSSLPQTIQDAITVTRNIGIRYLWVDSLCIIQDSLEDKANEIGRMSDIYRRAHITIAVAGAACVSDGFLSSRSLTARMRKQESSAHLWFLELPLTCPDGSPGAFIMRQSTRFLYLQEPLDKRAWAFQETLLSKRVLIFGTTTLTWRCQTRTAEWNSWPHGSYSNPSYRFFFQNHSAAEKVRGSAAETTPDSVPVGGSSLSASRMMHRLYAWLHRRERAWKSILRFPSVLMSPPRPTSVWDFTKVWISIVEEFSFRRLTYAEDALPAMSGIAVEAQRIFESSSGMRLGKYLAGVWEHNLGAQLLWIQEPNENGPLDHTPSWSWARAGGPVSYRRYHIGTIFAPIELFELLNCHTTPAHSSAPYGQVKQGKLTVRGRCVQGNTFRLDDSLFRSDPTHDDRHIFMDYCTPWTGHSPFHELLERRSEYAIRAGRSAWWLQLVQWPRRNQEAGLLLELVGNGTFKRIGMYCLEIGMLPLIEPTIVTIV